MKMKRGELVGFFRDVWAMIMMWLQKSISVNEEGAKGCPLYI